MVVGAVNYGNDCFVTNMVNKNQNISPEDKLFKISLALTNVAGAISDLQILRADCEDGSPSADKIDKRLRNLRILEQKLENEKNIIIMKLNSQSNALKSYYQSQLGANLERQPEYDTVAFRN